MSIATATRMESVDIDQENVHGNSTSRKRIFIPAIGSLGDVKPFLILAQELKNRGHIVWLGVHKRFEEKVKATGIDTVEIGGDMEISLSTTPDGIELQRSASVFKLGLAKRVLLPIIEEWFNGILAGVKDADFIVFPCSCVLVGLSCIEKYPNIKAIGIYTFPCVRTAEFTPPALGGQSESMFSWMNSLKWKMLEYGASSMYNDRINQLRASIDLAPIKLNYDQMIESIFHKPMKTATIYSKYLIPRPSDWLENDHLVGPILEEKNHDFQPSIDIQMFLDKWENEKIIYVGLGSMMSIMFGRDDQLEFLKNIQQAIGNNNCKAIISLVGLQQANIDKLTSDENIFFLKEIIPHCWLFPNMSATIHHGGAGTTHTSLRYGLPTLVLPFGADQPFNGDRIFVNKLGPRPIPIRKTNVKNLTNAISDLMQNYSMYQTNAKTIGESMRDEDGLGHCVRLIEAELMA
ncbi:unnamed protein product [Rotaria sordida]|uniref:Glycosyltransferase n=1 Tax=Rotaria sordida TaxID=392033 RepID=A0A815KHE2_9BILA|nr:unnamed protein product [Rotaria sordida]CAF4040611.1 unnamed protein product [Rotaria sordida]